MAIIFPKFYLEPFFAVKTIWDIEKDVNGCTYYVYLLTACTYVEFIEGNGEWASLLPKIGDCDYL